MKKKQTIEHDPYLILTKDIHPTPGHSFLDEARKTPRKSITRSYELVRFGQQARFKCKEGVILCPGAGCGRNEEGKVEHYWPGKNLEFIGFAIANSDGGEIAIKTAGSVILNLPGAQAGDKVYCTGPDSFGTEQTPGSALIGAIRFVQGNRAAVAFQRAGDKIPIENLLKY
jgi:hypothetical protein